jgi:hypothetical protein
MQPVLRTWGHDDFVCQPFKSTQFAYVFLFQLSATTNLKCNKPPQRTMCDFHFHVCSLYVNSQSLCMFAKLQRETISFTMYVHPSIHLTTWNNLTPTGQFSRNFISEDFQKYLMKLHVSIKSDQKYKILHMNTYVHLQSYLAEFSLE